MPSKDVTNASEVTEYAAPTTSDRLLIVKNSDGELYYITPNNLLEIINELTEETTPVTSTDSLLLYDASGAVAKSMKLVTLVNGLTEDTNPDEASDFVLTLDVSAGELKKTKPNNIAIAAGAGSPVQVVHTQTGAVATGTTTIPLDDTIPQNTEGTEFMTLSVTPTSATNKLLIDIVFVGGGSVAAHLIVALFQDSVANALAVASTFLDTANASRTISFRYEMVAGTASSTTFKIRAGTHSAGTTTFNGTASVRRFGGAIASSIRITEVKV